mmetsp:Transcript_61206/g.95073  ORF Transcript_61206/g.95073 Transcript_61206/m.95073 type:complete len:82 (-) Transcript_61206:3-248(-)
MLFPFSVLLVAIIYRCFCSGVYAKRSAVLRPSSSAKPLEEEREEADEEECDEIVETTGRHAVEAFDRDVESSVTSEETGED